MTRPRIPRSKKRPSRKKQPQEGPQVADDYYDQKPTWAFYMFDPVGPFGESIDGATLLRLAMDFLPQIETMKWKEILKRSHSGSHQHYERDLICSEAKKRMIQRELDHDVLVSLRVKGSERLWGIRQGAVCYLLWWDPEHKVCPVTKSNT